MRILQLRFKNLNSLSGEWSIDFTEPAYLDDGLFAITGPTGAGKSTLLDAVCLALYGRTPRLERINKSTNELMSRQTGACFAEVVFSTPSGRYRAHWSQHRARQHPDGELQAPKHEIADEDSGKVLASKLREVGQHIEQLTGMDFQRFTRSMLLAQGGFAAFLQASADERAPLLEQMTGTEIYSEISKAVHERRNQEKSILDRLQVVLEGFDLLDEEEQTRLNNKLADKEHEVDRLKRELEESRSAIDWLDGITRLEAELLSVDKKKRDWQQRFDAFTPDRARLELALKALELESDYVALQARRKEQADDRKTLDEQVARQPDIEQNLQRAEARFKESEIEWEKQLRLQQELLPKLKKVRQLDTKLDDKKQHQETTQAQITQLQQTLEEAKAKLTQDGQRLEEKKESLDHLRQKIEDAKADAELVTDAEGIRADLRVLLRLDETHKKTLLEKKKVADTKQAAAARLEQLQASLEAKSLELSNAEDKKAAYRAEEKELLNGRSLSACRNIQTGLVQRLTGFEQLGKYLREQTGSQQRIKSLSEKEENLGTALSKARSRLRDLEAERSSVEREVELLEENQLLRNRIADLEEARKDLREGQPCPLCGSVSHPWATGVEESAQNGDRALEDARSRLRKMQNQVTEEKIIVTKLEKDVEATIGQKAEEKEKLISLEIEIDGLMKKLHLEAGNDNLAERCETEISAIETKKAEIAQTIAQAEEIAKRLADVDEQLQTLNAEKHEFDLQISRARSQFENSEKELVRLAQSISDTETERSEKKDSLAVRLDRYGMTLPEEASELEALETALLERRRRWQQWQREKQMLEKEISALETSLSHQADRLLELNKDEEALKVSTQQLAREIKALEAERFELFGDRNADEEEARIQAAVDTARKKLTASQKNVEESRSELTTLQQRIKDIEKRIENHERTIEGMSEALLERMAAHGFADEISFEKARLSLEERSMLQRKAEQLDSERDVLLSREKELSQQLSDEKARALTTLPRASLENRLSELGKEHRGLLEKVGAIREQLERDQQLRSQHQAQVEKIGKQQKELERWNQLHDLIGSADGKKFRNFAQGLTFEIMLGHANRQLQTLTDRYLLLHDEKNPLDLNVIDNWQGGEVRSTKNLSGGESFIVSLALALGLAQMASRNVRVDSLFLDEGFGTLDEEALETALSTLAGLKQDGKLIGVISHVGALKERIATQIEVVPGSSGRSQITGPGCVRL